MKLKLIMAFVAEDRSEDVLDAARAAGATGATVITNVRGEGLKPEKTFFGLDLAAQCDVLLFLVAEPKAREILETIARVGRLDSEPGAGIACQIAIEDAVGLSSQQSALLTAIAEKI
ncbi:MAG: P-II family nitrogen regulator [Rhodospirillales bacterium]|nr:P-II family nitrogen regulator [Rhodospirillales bacterium]